MREVKSPRRLLRLLPLTSLICVILATGPRPAAGQGENFQNPNPRVSSPESRSLTTSLEVKFAKHTIGGTPVCLRTYENGRQLVGPTLRLKPGDTLNVELVNNLHLAPCPGSDQDPPVYQITNFHTHGLHVSPAGNSDNVLLEIKPKGKFQFEIKIPLDHPAGTFWYHAHVHGSTAAQVSNGMAGTLIIDGGSRPSLDDVPEIRQAMQRDREKVFVFQQIPYKAPNTLTEGLGIVGEAEVAALLEGWNGQTTINGQYRPVIRLKKGEVSRWRFIHAGVAATLRVGLEGHKLSEIAIDGLPVGTRFDRDFVMLQPGYRSDVLVKAERTGTFRLLDGATVAAESLQGVAEAENVLATVIVEDGGESMRLPDKNQLARYFPFPLIEDGELKPPAQNIEFDIAGGKFTINGKEYDPKAPPRLLELDSANVWNLSAKVGNHPFHIHVNPFQTTVLDETGKPWPIFRDTLLVTPSSPQQVRSRYVRYVGRFVLHCHNLVHEDRGMMELVEITLPGGPGAHAGHH